MAKIEHQDSFGQIKQTIQNVLYNLGDLEKGLEGVEVTCSCQTVMDCGFVVRQATTNT